MKRVLKIIFLTFVFTSASLAQTNLVTNPGFEDSVNIGWRLNAWGGAAGRLFNETGDNVISGNISAKVIVDTTGDKVEKVSLMTDTIKNVPDGELILTVLARTETKENLPFKLSLKCVSEDGQRKWYGGEQILLSTTPQKVTFIVSPDSKYRANIFVRLSCGLEKGTYIFDDVFFGKNEDVHPPVPEGRRLREIVADKYPEGNVYIGGASQSAYWGTFSEEILNREFSYITPANDFKQTYVHPEPGVFRWATPDGWVQKAKANGQVIRMHSPIGPQCSKWAKEDSRTPEELSQNLTEYVTALCQHYNNESNILWMDVVNETIDANTGEWKGPKPGTDSWENPWTIIGFDTTYSETFQPPLYIKMAFELANKYAPNIKQIINQHGSMNDAAWDKVKKLVTYLRDNGLRVDGIGFQAHVDAGWEKENNDSGVNNLTALGNLIEWAHSHNLEFHITENNVYLRGENVGDWEKQAETFRAILSTVLAHRSTGVVTWNTWMIRDSDGKASDRTPTLFFADGSPKPAYYAVQDVLENPVSVNESSDKIPTRFVLEQNYPNPFSAGGGATTTIKYSIPSIVGTAHELSLQLTVYDVLGRKIATLVNGYKAPGNYQITFNAKNLPSGTYFYRLKAGDFSVTKKMILLK